MKIARLQSPLGNLVVITLLTGLTGCSATKSNKTDFLDDMKNQGPVALSADDPYQPANLLVNYQIENSEIVAGFVKFNGVPQAVELESGWFRDPQVTYYYPRRREYYLVTKQSGDWNLLGPRRIIPEKQEALAKLELPPGRIAMHSTLIEEQHSASATGVQEFQPDLTSNVRPAVTAPIPTSTAVVPTPVDSNRQRLNKVIDNLVRQNQQESAEINQRGDVQHIVQLPNENSDLLAIWYTFDRSNSERINRINQHTQPGHLKPGDKIVIPGYLIQNRYKFSAAALQLLINEFSRQELGLTD